MIREIAVVIACVMEMFSVRADDDSQSYMRLILEIEHDSEGYEIKLSNRLEIKFNNKFQVVDIDD